MDSLQPWYGACFSLDGVYDYLKTLTSEDETKEKCNHELFVTWSFAKFLQARNKIDYLVGFPLKNIVGAHSISNIISRSLSVDEDFDTVIVEVEKPERPIRFQIKRYINNKDASTSDFVHYLITKTRKYGNDNKLNLIFDIQSALKLDLKTIQHSIINEKFLVGNIFVYFRRGVLSNIMEIHPKYTGIIFSPE